ncbi:DUF2753 domain-containing protein [Vibrio fluvialis]|jgi:hypothetical protein|uniref:DUF2753 domain-containing protein n=1 Tax=Vibrio fluvialis TaxID=676 RepID=UPI00192B8454|nr:DUF2753 domain-containing protein [Vibrio fluvialis]EKO3406656.1 DUF2753 domain-containing protein [Vibrio fluvialis]ELP2652449.1 DUF2753 domain-containing protein [Vibrio fluvialis]MBL4277925.1 DUF2753 domain-containing protein [Vibrio fluvialis]MBY8040211.1 DUF2753 domain-containing protein [Vibrio fluvialis]
MTIKEWEKHTLLADIAMQQADHLRSILHYQQALTLSDRLGETEDIELEDRLMISVISCHNMAGFWRTIGDNQYELKYLELASERILTLIPQCGNPSCEAFVDSLGCCKKALIEFMKRHPNPQLAKLVKDIDSASSCNLIAKFRLN